MKNFCLQKMIKTISSYTNKPLQYYLISFGIPCIDNDLIKILFSQLLNINDFGKI